MTGSRQSDAAEGLGQPPSTVAGTNGGASRLASAMAAAAQTPAGTSGRAAAAGHAAGTREAPPGARHGGPRVTSHRRGRQVGWSLVHTAAGKPSCSKRGAMATGNQPAPRATLELRGPASCVKHQAMCPAGLHVQTSPVGEHFAHCLWYCGWLRLCCRLAAQKVAGDSSGCLTWHPFQRSDPCSLLGGCLWPVTFLCHWPWTLRACATL